MRRGETWNALFNPCPVSFFLLFSLALSRGDWGFPVTWAVGSPSLILTLVHHHISFSLTISLLYLFGHDSSLSISFSVHRSFARAPLSAGLPELIISVFAACLWQGSLAGRKAGRWPLRSWVTQVRLKRCPWGACVSYPSGMPQNTRPLSQP